MYSHYISAIPLPVTVASLPPLTQPTCRRDQAFIQYGVPIQGYQDQHARHTRAHSSPAPRTRQRDDNVRTCRKRCRRGRCDERQFYDINNDPVPRGRSVANEDPAHSSKTTRTYQGRISNPTVKRSHQEYRSSQQTRQKVPVQQRAGRQFRRQCTRNGQAKNGKMHKATRTNVAQRRK